MPSYSNDIIFYLAANRMPFNALKFHRWLKHFSNIESLFNATPTELKQIGLNSNDIKILKNPDWPSSERELSWCEKNDCHLVTITDENYPALLREIEDAPLMLSVRGDVTLLSRPQIAIVGSRNPTTIGKEIAYDFAKHLAKAGFIITSGLALGIDCASHEGALETGASVAVLGTGVNHIYPYSHRELAEKMIAQGAIMSEFPLDEKPKAKNFPLRNRIISGLSLGVLVVEAAIQSGSLITARMALEQGREVFAIPGSIHNPMARGCHYLLRQGAKLVETAEDILEELSALLEIFQQKSPHSPVKAGEITASSFDEKHRHVLDQIGFERTAFDTIIVRSGLTASEVSSILLSLELSGNVETVPGGYMRSAR